MLRVENISTGYGKKQVLFDVSFEINKGEVVLLVGGNGSGKSTLFKAIFGMLPVWGNGKIYFEGVDLIGCATSDLLKKGLLYIPQKNNLFEDLTVKENLEMAGLVITDKKDLRRRIDYSLSVFTPLVPFVNRMAFKLSGGEKKQLTLAMALLHNPKMLLLDEPFTGLSNENIVFVRTAIETLIESIGITLLIVEHRIKECVVIANRVIGLKLGAISGQTDKNQKLPIDQLYSIYL